MTYKHIILSLLSSAIFITSASAKTDSHNVYGTYIAEDKGSKIKIEDCGNNSPCGTIVWLNPEDFDEGTDLNEIKSKAGNPVIGLEMLKDFKRKKNDWRGGTIYDPGKDKTYASRLKKLENGTLEVKGCISFFCITQIWTPTQ